MTQHQEFKQLMKKLGFTNTTLAIYLGLKPSSVTNILAPGKKELPRWAISMLLTNRILCKYVCFDCGSSFIEDKGKRFTKDVAAHIGECDLCGEEKPVTSKKHFNYLNR